MANTLQYKKFDLAVADLSAGVNNKIHAIYIPDNQSVDLQDVDPFTPGQLVTRNGYTQVADTPVASRGRGLFHYAPDNATKYLLGVSSEATQALYKWTGSGSWSTTGAGAITGFTSNGGANEVDFVQVNSNVYLINGVDKAVEWTGAAFNQQDGTVNAKFPSGTRCIAYWLGRIWTAGKAANPGYLYFSDPLNPTSWDQTNQVLRVAYGTGQSIVAIQPLRSGQLIVFLNRSIWQITPLDNDVFGLATFGIPTPQSFRLDEIDPLIGCGAQRSVQLVGNDIIFMDQYGDIRSLARTITDNSQGTKSLPVSDAIRNFVSTFTGGSISKASAVVYKNRYYISVATNSSTDNSATFVYDIVLNSWAGPWSFGITRFATSDIETAGQYFFYGFKPEANFKAYRMESGTTDNSTAISYQETTKRYTFGDLNKQKIGRMLYVNLVSNSNANMLVEASTDGAGYTSLGSFNMQGNALTLPQTLPFTLGGGGTTTGKFHLDSLNRWKDIQFRFNSDTADAVVKKLGHTIEVTVEDARKED